jgi:hypothetical protein
VNQTISPHAINYPKSGCDVEPVGYHDSQNNDIQWRISFPGEQTLVFDLSDVQILCYALIKIILFLVCPMKSVLWML